MPSTGTGYQISGKKSYIEVLNCPRSFIPVSIHKIEAGHTNRRRSRCYFMQADSQYPPYPITLSYQSRYKSRVDQIKSPHIYFTFHRTREYIRVSHSNTLVSPIPQVSLSLCVYIAQWSVLRYQIVEHYNPS